MNEKYFFFWGEAPFSQWSKSNFVIDGVTYNCCEQFMMAEKAKMFNDLESLTLIMESDSPSVQKRFGRDVKNFNKDTWNAFAKTIVYQGNYAKFTQNQEMKQQLFATYPKILVEASPSDKIWGIGMTDFQARTTPPDQWLGTNWLGTILTKLRNDLMEAEGLLSRAS